MKMVKDGVVYNIDDPTQIEVFKKAGYVEIVETPKVPAKEVKTTK